ncbi:carbonic anhydrase 2-like [Diprion similis]|uniref:carbonic anhydrase 2-like n=1 Tax=Diprion similis TaxID=362088 RepID=UPI001EF95E0B|nr:carbonic anhydrase 2-like [Diprion similis]XP_046739069.1 carbonic anhydrase 2-like [Diprion similis]XP_046739070.1 carbonic anhydrase 2-like [Diprion similis]
MYLLYQASALLAILQVVHGGFGYSKRHQHTWAQQHKHCAGKWQSPIALSSANAEELPLPAIETISYHNLLSGPIKLTNNGHSVALSIHKDLSKKRLPYVFGGLLNKGQNYELEGLHFHWGMKNNRGSEHILNGIRFPMEMHIIHRNMKYANADEAYSYEDGLTVLAVFFQLQEEDNDKLSPILNTFPAVQWFNSTVKMNVSITLASLMPENTDIFYTYRGSLTTPPCYEVVTWNIFPTPVPISFKQMNKFRMLSSGEETLADNYRRLQELGNRKVYVRRMDPSFARSEDMINLNLEKLKWVWQ